MEMRDIEKQGNPHSGDVLNPGCKRKSKTSILLLTLGDVKHMQLSRRGAFGI
jgi:hypothetical protein